MRRVTLIDQNETPNYMTYWGLGLGDEIYTIQQLDSMEESCRNHLLTFKEGDGILIVGSEPFHRLQERYHFGIRSENYFDCSKLYRLSIEGGAFVRVILDPPSPDQVSDFMSPGFSEPRDFSWFKSKNCKTLQDALRLLYYMDSLPEDTNYGFDYEASGMPLDKWFEISGASICTVKFGGFISFTDIRHEVGKDSDGYRLLLKTLGDFLVKRQNHIWTYNMQYEFQVSHRMLGVDLYNLCDASVFNVLDGNHLKKYSLKWTANMILGSTVWDTEFDYISELIDSMLFTVEGRLKKDKHKVLRVTKADYQNTDEWKKLATRYPEYVCEFTALIDEYWGNPFMIIPSDILAKYCNLDAFYTLMIYETKKSEYTEKAIGVFMDNIRLATRLHSCGINKDEDFRRAYEVYCKNMQAWGITYCAEARCKIKMRKHAKKMAKLESFHPVAQRLLKRTAFFSGDAVEISKYLLLDNLDKSNTFDLGLDEGKLALTYGEDFTLEFLKIVRESMVEVKLKIKIDETIKGKKKILGIIAEKLTPLIGLDKLKGGTKQEELEKYMYYEKAYNELMKVSKHQLRDINNIPSTIKAFNKTFTPLQYADYVSNNYFKCKSPVENDQICLEFAELYKPQSAFLAAMIESTQQLKNTEKFYEKLGIKTVEEAYEHFMCSWEKVVNGAAVEETDYPAKVYNLASTYYSKPDSDQVKEIWSNFNGYTAQSQFFKYVDDQFLEYGKVFDENDLNEDFFFMRKLVLSYLLYKKYAKVLTTYIGTFDEGKQENVGMFLGSDSYVIENPKNHVMIREADPDEPGAVVRMKPKFQCMEKSSKRWSSGYHTIISHSDIKSTVRSYPGCLLTYFDINQN